MANARATIARANFVPVNSPVRSDRRAVGRHRLVLCAVWAGFLAGISTSTLHGDEPPRRQGFATDGAPDGQRDRSAVETSERIRTLIDALGSPDFLVRQAAQDDLIRFGPVAFDAVYGARNHVDLEIASRARFILRTLRVEWTERSDATEVRRIMRDYDLASLEDRRGRIDQLGMLPLADALPVLVRLARYESDELLSKQAALHVLASTAKSEARPDRPSFARPWPVDTLMPGEGFNPWRRALPARSDASASDAALTESPAMADEKIIAVIHKQLVRHGGDLDAIDRTAAVWLRAEAEALADPSRMAELWLPLVESEVRTCFDDVDACSPEILRQLLRPTVTRLMAAGFDEPAEKLASLAIDLCDGTVAGIHDLSQWAMTAKLPGLVESLAARFPQRFDQEPELAYDRAAAAASRGDSDAAQRYAREASALIQNPLARLSIGRELENQGRVDWAIQEYRLALAADGDSVTYVGIQALLLLTLLLRDQDRDAEAIVELDRVRDWAKAHPARWEQLQSNLSGSFEEMMRYHLMAAKAALAQDDRKTALNHIRDGLKEQEPDVDLLILAFRTLDRRSVEWTTLERILTTKRDQGRAKIEEFERKVATLSPEQQVIEATGERYSQTLNQYAWLVSNTEGDLAFACRCSHRSVEFRPDEAASIDTLGRCYYALGLYDLAVTYQRYAVALEPHRGEMVRQLRLFEEAAAKQAK